ncbi:AmmeMemoRadiSam system protein A [Verrucomicrobiota bacterium]
MKEIKSGEWSPGLSEEEQKTLFLIAKDTLARCVKEEKEAFSFSKYQITDKLKKATHTFVTLKINGRLRGCIGSLPPMPAKPMYESVYDNAISAALRDMRFAQVTVGELEELDVHISLLSPVKSIASVDEFKIGQHGIILSRQHNRAVFLPEVAVEQNWSKEETLSCLSQKAGMERDAWRSGAEFEVFESVVLAEE